MIKKLMLLALLVGSVMSAGAKLVFQYKYDHNAHTCVVTGHDGTPDTRKVYIPLGISYPGSTSNYKVIGIESNAINGISGMDTIVIPNTVEYIGSVKSTADKVYQFVDIHNFRDCPDLKYIKVTDGNKIFKSTGAGILTSLDGSQVFAVPPRIDVSANGGTLKMGTSCVAIGKDAFKGNTTIKHLVFSKNLEYLHPEFGVRTMTALESMTWPQGGIADNMYMVDNNAIIRKTDKKLLFYPPACPEATYIVTPINVNLIGDHAFANTTRLKEVIFPEGMKTIGNYVFENSSVERVTFPSTLDFVTGTGYGAFKNSKIKELTWNATEKRHIPRDFMLNCSELTAVNLAIPFGSVGSSAFRNCVKLKTLPPFDIKTTLTGDSVYANTGLEKVTFIENERETDSQIEAKAIFAGCKHLKRLDMYNIQICDDKYRMNIPESFAGGCDSLASLWLPGFVRIDASCFRGCSQLKKLVLQQAEIVDGPLFTYHSDNYVAPEVLVKTPPHCGGTFDSRYDLLFANTGSGEIVPHFYYEERETRYGTWLVSPSVNYIPAGCFHLFPKATPQTPVYSMFDFKMVDTGDKMQLVFTTTPAVKITNVEVNLFPTYQNSEVTKNVAEFDHKYMDCTLMFIFYQVDGLPYVAGYSENQFPWNLKEVVTGVEEVNGSNGIRLAGDKLYVGEGTETEVYDMSGLCVARSSESEVNLSELPRGIYVVMNGGKRIKIRI